HEEARRYLTLAHLGRADGLTWLGKHAEALKTLDEALRLKPDGFQTRLREERFLALARLGRHDEALSAFRELRDEPDAGAQAHALARATSIQAIQSRDDRKLTKEQRERASAVGADAAMGLLRKALAAGYFKYRSRLKDLQTHPDFRAVREHAVYKQL